MEESYEPFTAPVQVVQGPFLTELHIFSDMVDSDDGLTFASNRPSFGPLYGVSADPEGMLDWSWVDERLERSRNYWVVTARADGQPHAAPVWGVWVDGAIWFGTEPRSVKSKNLVRSGRVTINLESGDEVVIVEGTAQPEHATGEAFERVDHAYEAKYGMSAQGPGGVFWSVRPRKVLAWREEAFVDTPTCWEFG